MIPIPNEIIVALFILLQFLYPLWLRSTLAPVDFWSLVLCNTFASVVVMFSAGSMKLSYYKGLEIICSSLTPRLIYRIIFGLFIVLAIYLIFILIYLLLIVHSLIGSVRGRGYVQRKFYGMVMQIGKEHPDLIQLRKQKKEQKRHDEAQDALIELFGKDK
jgi:hypothetical protein